MQEPLQLRLAHVDSKKQATLAWNYAQCCHPPQTSIHVPSDGLRLQDKLS